MLEEYNPKIKFSIFHSVADVSDFQLDVKTESILFHLISKQNTISDNRKEVQMSRFLILGGNGMLAYAIKTHPFFTDHIAVDIDECDITKRHEIDKIIMRYSPHFVINCAAYTDVTGAEQDFATAEAVNSLAVRHIASSTRDLSIKFVHFSTDFVFRGDKNIEYTEDMTPDPVNAYGRSKESGEAFIKLINPDALVIRVSWLYGPNGKNFVSTISQLMSQKTELKIVSDQYGKTTYTIDVAEATKNLITRNAIGIYHFANEGVCSRYEFTQKIHEILCRNQDINCSINPINAREYPDPTPRPTWSILSTEKYAHDIGEKPRHWESALTDFLTPL
jgi:dTDP-4-dehydrorhamnose reductase